MKPPTEWSEKDLIELISLKVEEDLHLEFKAAESLDPGEKKQAEISKDVSAFANSDGGTIVYGIAESKSKPAVAESLSPIDPSKYSKEWLEQIINSRIQRRIQGIVINAVSLTGGQVAYVVSIPASTTAHQAHDGRYYRRYNFQSVFMQDYEVRQTLNRTSRAAYRVELETRQRGLQGSDLLFRFQAGVENISELIGRDASVSLLVPKHLLHNEGSKEILIAGVSYSRIPGTWFGTGPSGAATIGDVPPESKKMVDFDREVRIPNINYSTPLRVFVRVFDRVGLALTTEVQMSVPDLKVISAQAAQIDIGQ